MEWHDESVQFEDELARFLPPDIPHREPLIHKAAQHLSFIAEVNEYMNLTRLTNPREAAIKHVYDSLSPWAFFNDAQRVLDAGTGAGFPGVPLSLALPHIQFTLSESVQKKARFVESVVDRLELPNVQVTHDRAEEVAVDRKIDLITARAIAPTSRIIDLFRKSLKRGARLILYKGPDTQAELHEAEQHRVSARVLCRYELPEGLGARSVLEICANSSASAAPRRRARPSQ